MGLAMSSGISDHQNLPRFFARHSMNPRRPLAFAGSVVSGPVQEHGGALCFRELCTQKNSAGIQPRVDAVHNSRSLLIVISERYVCRETVSGQRAGSRSCNCRYVPVII